MGVGRGDGGVLPPPVRREPARPELGEPGGPAGRLLDDELVARPRRRRLPDGRHQPDLQGDRPRVTRPARRRGRRRRRAGEHAGLRRPGPLRPQRPAGPRLPPGDAPRGLRRPPRRAAHGGGDPGDLGRPGAPLHRPRPRRGRHGLPVRARRPRLRPARQVGHRPDDGARPQGLAVPLAGGPRGGRLEQPLPRQPRPAAPGQPLRGRLARAPRGLRDRPGDHAPPAARHAVRLPG